MPPPTGIVLAGSWIGVALLVDVGWGAGLIGVGSILLVEQLVRWHLALDHEKFWVIAGAVAVGFGAGIAAGLGDALVPIVLVLVGAMLVATTFGSRAGS